ncbi:hypothetical protein EDM57_04320 [Brevibacillus gelatini]|uniref:Uncharacterized protein n=1 Tax=Brevibacillus gelatini TaxID=1655277 RepID=A0A3M8B7F0_9BACL|nr:hypothetical protein [Brevibacillus gelatini]RNB59374.1 hypothetical protein EDM57_04320 [Brevibacillus gelatini]
MNHFKNHWILYLFVIITLILSIAFPDIEITLTGGLGWFLLNTVIFISAILIIVGVKGGEVSYSSEGAIPLIKKLFNKER